MKTFLDYLRENHLEPGTKLKKGDEELQVVKPVGKDKYLVKEEDLDEAVSYQQTHTKWGVVPKSKKEFVKFFDKSKEAEAKAHAEKTGGTLKKIDQLGRAIKEEVVDESNRSEYSANMSMSDRHSVGTSPKKFRLINTKTRSTRGVFDSHASAKAALANHPLKKHLVIEEVELTEAKHRVSVTVSDPNHTAVSKRKEQTLKTVRVSAENESDAVTKAKAFYKKQGYKVHDAAHAGMVHEEVEETDESTVIRTQNGRKMVSAEVAIRLAREIAAKRKEGEKATTNDLKQATKALTREEAEQIDGD